MNRRSFFRKAATGAAVLAAAPSILSEPFMPKTYTTYLFGKDAVITDPTAEWVTYKFVYNTTLPPGSGVARIRYRP